LKLRFDSESNEKLIQFKNEICPSLEIDYFNGTYDFGEKLPSVDESLPIKGQKHKMDYFTEIKNEMILQSMNSQKEEHWGEEPLMI